MKESWSEIESGGILEYLLAIVLCTFNLYINLP